MIDDYQLLFMLYMTVTNVVSVLSGLLLWVTFVFFGIVSRRYEQIFKVPTNWQVLVLAPTGILAYTVIQAFAYATFGTMTPAQS